MPILGSSQSCTGDIAVFLEQVTNDFVKNGETKSSTFSVVSPSDFRTISISCNNDVLDCSGLSITVNFGDGTSSTISSAGEQISITITGSTTIIVEGVNSGLTTINLNGGICNNEEYLIYSVDQIEQNACDCANFLAINRINIGQTISCGVKNPTEPYVTDFAIDPDQTQMPYRAVVALPNGTERVLTNDAPSATVVNMNAIFITGIEGGQRNIRSYGGLSADCDRSFDAIIVNSIVLPVTFTLFDGYELNSYSVELTWETSYESENEKFKIEKSLDGLIWRKIGEVLPNIHLNYKFIDTNFSINNYYRINQVDYSGQESYSKTIFVKRDHDKLQEVLVFPNPSSQQISFRFIEGRERPTTKVNISVTSITGEKVIKINDFDWRDIPVYNLTPGTYIVKLIYSDQELTSQLVIK
jgi:hypothetical protein